MAALRQQRSKRNRRLLSRGDPPRVATPAVVTVAKDGDHKVNLELLLISYPPDTSANIPRLVVKGLPRILRDADSAWATNVEWFPLTGILSVTFGGANIAPGEYFYLGPQDPALRTAQGGFVAPGFFLVP